MNDVLQKWRLLKGVEGNWLLPVLASVTIDSTGACRIRGIDSPISSPVDFLWQTVRPDGQMTINAVTEGGDMFMRKCAFKKDQLDFQTNNYEK